MSSVAFVITFFFLALLTDAATIFHDIIGPLFFPTVFQVDKVTLDEPFLHEEVSSKAKKHHLDDLVDKEVMKISSKGSKLLLFIFLSWQVFLAVLE